METKHYFYIIAFLLAGIMTAQLGDEDGDGTLDDASEIIQNNKNRLDSIRNELDKDGSLVSHQNALEGDPFEELDQLVGLESVKEEVHSLANFVKIQQERKKQGMKVPKISYHCVFTGNPGTGKTTIARILARIYKDLGVLKSGHLVETDQSGLVAEYVGQTAVKTNAVIDSALNGVLFIDEAYAITESKGGYGEEAIATLLKRMEDDRDRLIVIVAGYTNEMQRFIDSNPGLKSRFTRYIEFKDYTDKELADIFYLSAKKYSYTLDSKADAFLRQQMGVACRNKGRNFGNGRYVRNIFEKAITVQANRLSKTKNPSSEDLQRLTESDLKEAFETVQM